MDRKQILANERHGVHQLQFFKCQCVYDHTCKGYLRACRSHNRENMIQID